jgi:hypothetical protein
MLSFVLPFTLPEKFSDPGSWRSKVNEDGNAPLILFLRSFVYLLAQRDLSKLIVVCPTRTVRSGARPASDCHEGSALRRGRRRRGCAWHRGYAEGEWRRPWRLECAADRQAHCPPDRRHKPLFCPRQHPVCIRPCSYDSSIVDARPLLNIESMFDYAKLYRSSFVDKEVATKVARRLQSQRLLGKETSTADAGQFYGETPVVLSAHHVAAMLGELERVHGKAWIAVLAAQAGGTEYGLYFGYLDALHLTDTVCWPGNCNAILSLNKSIWQETANYWALCEYDRDHFFDGSEAHFVAIQSRIATSEWLPARHDAKFDFYPDMEDCIRERYATSTLGMPALARRTGRALSFV